jgi:hypothetical protein
MKKDTVLIVILLIILVGIIFSLSSCFGWKSQYSYKSEEENEIVINLYKEGAIVMGPCLSRDVLDKYSFRLSPIKTIYKDDEIKVTRKWSNDTIRNVKGTISFNKDYKKVTIDIYIPKDSTYDGFKANGKYKTKIHD